MTPGIMTAMSAYFQSKAKKEVRDENLRMGVEESKKSILAVEKTDSNVLRQREIVQQRLVHRFSILLIG